MADTANPYIRLPGRQVFSASGAICSLYLGGDHLLSLRSYFGVVEDYKRFYYRDIQGLLISETKTGDVWSLLLALPMIGFALLAWKLHGEPVGFWISVSVAVLFLILLVIHLIKGPTCASYIR